MPHVGGVSSDLPPFHFPPLLRTVITASQTSLCPATNSYINYSLLFCVVLDTETTLSSESAGWHTTPLLAEALTWLATALTMNAI